MTRSSLATVALALICLASTDHPAGHAASFEIHKPRKPPAAVADSTGERERSKRILVAESVRTEVLRPERLHERPNPEQVLWHPDPNGESPFGQIPTTWTARPEFLPTTWDVRTIPAGIGQLKAEAPRPKRSLVNAPPSETAPRTPRPSDHE